MEGIEIFSNEEFGEIRTVVIDGEPWFVGKDVARALGYGEGKSLNNAVANHVDEEDKGVTGMMTPRGKQNFIVINESGMYALIFGSRLESAKRFKHWVTSEVLPAIRKTGRYIAPSEGTMESMFEAMSCDMKMVYEQMNKFDERMESVESMMQEQSGKLNQVVDNMTLTTRQQQRIYKAAKDRINHLLGGAHSEEYKSCSKSYFINLWNGLKAEFDCGGSYKDLNPVYFDAALGYIGAWRYVET